MWNFGTVSILQQHYNPKEKGHLKRNVMKDKRTTGNTTVDALAASAINRKKITQISW